MYVCMYENKHLHKSQGTLSISCYTSCEGLGLAKTTKNVRNCKCRGKSSGLVFLGLECLLVSRQTSFLLRITEESANTQLASMFFMNPSWEPHFTEPRWFTYASVPLLMRASSGQRESSLPWNGWSKRVDLCFLPSHKPWEQRFSFLSPSKFLNPVKDDVHRLFVLMCVL